MNILFYPLKSRANKSGLCKLMIRVTVGPKDKAEIPTDKKVDPKLWDVDKKKVSGKSANADMVNKYISFVENKLNQIELELQLKEQNYNAEIIKNLFTGEAVKKHTWFQIIDEHNALYKKKIGQKGFTESTLMKYENLKLKFTRYIKLRYRRSDLFISEIKIEFIENFWEFLITQGRDDSSQEFNKGLDEETACVIIAKVKKLGKIAFKKSGIILNPFDEFKCSFTKDRREPLTIEELQRIIDHKFHTKRLDKVRDRFVVGCLTGMANADIQSANTNMLSKDINGNWWIDRGRTKTGELCLIPLWQPVLDIIEKYKEDPDVLKTRALFPQMSLQKMNEYLAEIADLCGIDKKLTTHISRHTFANVYLNAGGDINILARILGHSTVNSTRKYGKHEKFTIANDAGKVMHNVFNAMKKNSNKGDNEIKIAN